MAEIDSGKSLRAAKLHWRNGVPSAPDYGDIYHSPDAAAEVHRVFMGPADIERRLRQGGDFCIGEFGYGTGLNFAVAATAALSASDCRLHFISFEKHPLSQNDRARVAAAHPDLPFYAQMQDQPLPVLPGWHRRIFADGRIVLTVFHGEAASGLAELVQSQRRAVDAWFLDGFAPDRNPQLWQADLLAQLAALSRAGTTVTTFTAAGQVRRDLQAAGFSMRRVDQRPFKRESLAGVFQSDRAKTEFVPPRQVTVWGAGIGGASMARHLAELGCQVSLIDPQGLARAGSSIGAAVLHARLLADGSPDADMRSKAFHYASNYYRRFDGFNQTGALQVQGANLDAAKMARIGASYGANCPEQDYWLRLLTQTEACALSGANCQTDALWFPTAGTVDMPALCRALIAHPRIELREALPQQAAQIKVLCTAGSIRAQQGCEALEVVNVQGQLDLYEMPNPPRLPVVGNGYAVPVPRGCLLGATYEHKPWDPEHATEHNLAKNRPLLGEQPLQWRDRQRAARAISSDRAPIVGQLDEQTWVATALGSMGTTAAPLAAAMVASRLMGWSAPTAPAIERLLRPERFAERQARRGVRHSSPAE